MQELVAGMERLRVELEADVEQQGGAQPLPFPGTSPPCSVTSPAAISMAGTERAVVCKHWLRGLCKKGDGCGFLHSYNVTKRPECYFHAKFGECSIKDCPFLHVDTTVDNSRACPWYDRGFCRNGPSCKYKHRRRVMCANYLVGFCPEGPNWFGGTSPRVLGVTASPCAPLQPQGRAADLQRGSSQGDSGGSHADPPRAEAPSPVSLLQGSRGSQGIGVSDCLVSPQGAQCPRGLAHAAGGESSPEDVLAAGTAQHGAAQPRDSSSIPLQPAVAAGARHLLQGGWFWGWEPWVW
uniref:Cleavage and polyadenylation specificity factor subunit 4 n=1 Tax=Anas platyrhynchos TaxID=8839 RepID=A0A8B9R2H2_ANAPL